jgi:hypothetical protein
MREITIGEKTLGLKASPVALLYYKQEFKTDLIGDLIKMEKIGENIAKIDTVVILQLIWVMNKAAEGPGKQFPNFEKWLESLDCVDFTDSNLLSEVMAEATAGFFRSRGIS